MHNIEFTLGIYSFCPISSLAGSGRSIAIGWVGFINLLIGFAFRTNSLNRMYKSICPQDQSHTIDLTSKLCTTCGKKRRKLCRICRNSFTEQRYENDLHHGCLPPWPRLLQFTKPRVLLNDNNSIAHLRIIRDADKK